MSNGELIVFIIGLVFAVFLYFTPFFVSKNRNHDSSTTIFWLNLLLAWSAVAWIVLLIWALSGKKKVWRPGMDKEGECLGE